MTSTDWDECHGGGVDVESEESVVGHSFPTTLMPGSTTAEIGGYFRSKAEAVFGAGHYLIEAITFDPAFPCTLATGQSYASNLASVVADRAHLFPLCQSYAPALSGVSSFANELVQSRFPLVLQHDERVTFVAIVANDGSERRLSGEQFSYDRATQLLSIDRAVLRATDASLRLEVTSECRGVPQ